MKNKNIDTNKKHNKKIIIIVSVIINLVIIALGIAFVIMINKGKIFKYKQEISDIKKQNSSAIVDYKENIEYKTEWTYEKLLKTLIDESKLSDKTNIKITVNDEELNDSSVVEFDTVGSYKIVIVLNKKYSYKTIKKHNKNIEVKKEVTLNVEDTIYPVIEGVSDKTITVGNKIDLLKGISANDEVEGKIEVQVEGEVDTSKAGTYKIKVFAIDANGNKTEKEFTVTVKAKSTTTSSSSNKTSSGTSNNNTNGTSSNNSTGCTYTSLLKKRGYSSKDPDACTKNDQASAVARQIANSILAQGYTTDLQKVQAAANQVAANYNRANHVETGLDYATPYGVFVTHSASCAGTTRALIQVLEYMGYTNLTHANENLYTHQWVILTIDGEVGYADGQVGWVGKGPHPSAQ